MYSKLQGRCRHIPTKNHPAGRITLHIIPHRHRKSEAVCLHIYELEFLPEVLFGSTYRRSLTTVFPRFLHVMSRHHEEDIRRYFLDAFGFDSSIEESSRKLTELFASFGVPMWYDGEVSREQVGAIPCQTELSKEEVFAAMEAVMRK